MVGSHADAAGLELDLDVLAALERLRHGVGSVAEAVERLREHEDYLCEELLATGVELGSAAGETHTVTVDGAEVSVSLRKA